VRDSEGAAGFIILSLQSLLTKKSKLSPSVATNTKCSIHPFKTPYSCIDPIRILHPLRLSKNGDMTGFLPSLPIRADIVLRRWLLPTRVALQPAGNERRDDSRPARFTSIDPSTTIQWPLRSKHIRPQPFSERAWLCVPSTEPVPANAERPECVVKSVQPSHSQQSTGGMVNPMARQRRAAAIPSQHGSRLLSRRSSVSESKDWLGDDVDLTEAGGDIEKLLQQAPN
jgi:hypothetical protein